MSRATSPSAGKPYGLARVCRIWRTARATVYRHRVPPRQVAPRRPGPVGAMPDADLVAAIRAVLAASPFHGEGHRKVLCGRLQEAKPILSSPQRQAAQATQTGASRSASAGRARSIASGGGTSRRAVGLGHVGHRPTGRAPSPARRRSRVRAGDLAGVRNGVSFGNRRSALGEDPVRCALMSGLSRGACRWPSWVCACVPGTILGGVLEAHHLARYGLDRLDYGLPITRFGASYRISRACARRLPGVPGRHADAAAAAATRPFAW